LRISFRKHPSEGNPRGAQKLKGIGPREIEEGGSGRFSRGGKRENWKTRKKASGFVQLQVLPLRAPLQRVANWEKSLREIREEVQTLREPTSSPRRSVPGVHLTHLENRRRVQGVGSEKVNLEKKAIIGSSLLREKFANPQLKTRLEDA